MNFRPCSEIALESFASLWLAYSALPAVGPLLHRVRTEYLKTERSPPRFGRRRLPPQDTFFLASG